MPLTQEAAARELGDSLQRIVSKAREERLAALVSKADSGPLSTEEKDEFRRLQPDPPAALRPT